MPIGYVQATLPLDEDEAEIAWVIGRAWQGRGLASRAAHLIVDEVAKLGTHRLVAHIHPEHAVSQGVARSLGMHPTEIVVDGELRWIGTVDEPRRSSREDDVGTKSLHASRGWRGKRDPPDSRIVNFESAAHRRRRQAALGPPRLL